MSHVRSTGPDARPAPASTEQLEHQVEAQREELAATVHAISHKLDVKTQAGMKAEQAMDRATTETGKPRPEILAAAAAVLAAAVGLAWWRRHR